MNWKPRKPHSFSKLVTIAHYANEQLAESMLYDSDFDLDELQEVEERIRSWDGLLIYYDNGNDKDNKTAKRGYFNAQWMLNEMALFRELYFDIVAYGLYPDINGSSFYLWLNPDRTGKVVLNNLPEKKGIRKILKYFKQYSETSIFHKSKERRREETLGIEKVRKVKDNFLSKE
jgi:hypothetical protein